MIKAYRFLFRFLRKPYDKKDPNQTFKQRGLKLFQILILDLCLLGFIAFLIVIFREQGVLGLADERSKDADFSLWELFFAAVIVAPLLEELIFRYPLRFKNNLLLKFGVWCASLVSKKEKAEISKRLEGFWNKRFGFLFYIAALLFGAAHLVNYNLALTAPYILIVLLFVRFIIGLLLGYIRIRYNLFLSIFLHGLHNSLVLIVPLLLIGPSTTLLTKKNKKMFFQVEEVNYGGSSKIWSKEKGVLSYQNYPLKSVISQLSNTRELLIVSNKPAKLETRINLKFSGYESIESKARKDTILKYLAKGFGFSMRTSQEVQAFYWLALTDTTKLVHSKIGAKSLISFSDNQIKLKNASLISKYGINLAGFLTSKLDKITLCDTIRGKYNFKLPKSPQKIPAALAKRYGIKIMEKEKKMKHLHIHFTN